MASDVLAMPLFLARARRRGYLTLATTRGIDEFMSETKVN